MADWNSISLKIPGKDLLDSVRGVLETLLLFLDILKALLQTIQTFLVDFGNPIRALVQALMALIQQLFDSLKQTGLYYYQDVPDPLKDPNFHRYIGGYQAFTQRFIGSLYDSRDPFRPQPAPGIVQSGFILLAVDAESVFGLLTMLKVLLKFFGKEFSSPQYAPPGNPKVLLAGAKPGSSQQGQTDPILNVASVFGAELKGLVVEWGLSTNTIPPTPDFGDLVANAASEFIPQKFLIEKSSSRPVPLTVDRETPFENKRGRKIKRKVKVKDEYGDVFKKFEEYIVIDSSENTGTFLLGQLGKFRYIDNEVEPNKTYYYRIRAFSGDLDISGTSLNFKDPVDGTDPLSGEPVQQWPSKDPKSPVVMGRPTGILQGRVPVIPANFDVIGNLENIFLTAFSLGFQMAPDPETKFDSHGNLTSGPPTGIGRGSLQNKGGVLTSLVPEPPQNRSGELQAPDPVTSKYQDVYFNKFPVKHQSKRLAQAVASAMLENPGAATSFRTVMQGTAPKPLSPPANTNLEGATTIEKMVAGFVMLPEGFPEVYDQKVYATYAFGFGDANFRHNVLSAVQFILSFTLGGVPPDWQSVSLLKDIIPWSGQFIYDLLNRIDALLAAFKGILDEVKAFIDVIIRKIDVLERFIKYLLQILNFLDSISIGFYLLKVASTDGGVPDWIAQIQNAGGDRPPSGPGGYTGGVALAWAAPNIDAFTKAIDILF